MTLGISKETAEMAIRFRDERNWKQFHNPKDLAISISLEAAELLEVFQWSGGGELEHPAQRETVFALFFRLRDRQRRAAVHRRHLQLQRRCQQEQQ